MKKVLLSVILVLVAATLLAAGCVSSQTSSQSNSSSTTAPAKNYAPYFGVKIASQGNVPVDPITLTTNQTYVGTYRYTGTNASTWHVQIMSSEGAATDRYGQLLLEKTNDGFTGAAQANKFVGNTVFGQSYAAWTATKITSSVSGTQYVLLYGYNNDIDQWFVATISNDILE